MIERYNIARTHGGSMNRPYVGCKDGRREVFKSRTPPTEASHGGVYNCCIGPFRTMRAARFTAEHGANNPHIRTVADAERIVRTPGN